MMDINAGWDYCNLTDPQVRLDRFFEQNQGTFSHEYLAERLFFGDTVEERKQIERWKKRYPNDFHEFGKEIKVYGMTNGFNRAVQKGRLNGREKKGGEGR